MQVKFTEDFEVTVNKLMRKTYPKGWSGEVDDKIADAALKAKKAVRPDIVPVGITDDAGGDAGKAPADTKGKLPKA